MPVSLHPLFPDQPGQRLLGIGRDEAVIARLRAEYAAVRKQGDRLAREFYRLLFGQYPQLRPMFQSDPEIQRAKLMNSLDTVIEFLDRPKEQAEYLAALGARHVEYGARAEHYPIVARLLAEALVSVLGDSAEPGGFDDWHDAFALVSEQMIAGTR